MTGLSNDLLRMIPKAQTTKEKKHISYIYVIMCMNNHIHIVFCNCFLNQLREERGRHKYLYGIL